MNKLLMLAFVLLTAGTFANAASIDTVFVGDAGNVPDTRYATPGYGAVAYNYNIGKYEVTAAQYVEFLNAKAKTDAYGLYNASMGNITQQYGCNIQRNGISGAYVYSVASDWANRPVNYVSYWDACRFANWLNNGQGNGDTETGAYTLNGYTGNDGHTIQRNAGAAWYLPSEDEWYKAAYYKGGGTNAGYWDYPTQSNTVPDNRGLDGFVDPGNHANYRLYGTTYTIDAPYYRNNVGEFENSASAYGTYDQGGNVWEWNESTIYDVETGYNRGDRGGSFAWVGTQLQASTRASYSPSGEHYIIGFRVASSVPEPSSLFALGTGLVVLLGWRRRRAGIR